METQLSESAVITGRPEEVWTLITNPKHFQTWYAFGGAEIDLRPGGAVSHATLVQIVESGDLENPAQSALAWRNSLTLLGELARRRCPA